jgi:hypothetical protein
MEQEYGDPFPERINKNRSIAGRRIQELYSRFQIRRFSETFRQKPVTEIINLGIQVNESNSWL